MGSCHGKSQGQRPTPPLSWPAGQPPRQAGQPVWQQPTGQSEQQPPPRQPTGRTRQQSVQTVPAETVSVQEMLELLARRTTVSVCRVRLACGVVMPALPYATLRDESRGDERKTLRIGDGSTGQVDLWLSDRSITLDSLFFYAPLTHALRKALAQVTGLGVGHVFCLLIDEMAYHLFFDRVGSDTQYQMSQGGGGPDSPVQYLSDVPVQHLFDGPDEDNDDSQSDSSSQFDSSSQPDSSSQSDSQSDADEDAADTTYTAVLENAFSTGETTPYAVWGTWTFSAAVDTGTLEWNRGRGFYESFGYYPSGTSAAAYAAEMAGLMGCKGQGWVSTSQPTPKCTKVMDKVADHDVLQTKSYPPVLLPVKVGGDVRRFDDMEDFHRQVLVTGSYGWPVRLEPKSAPSTPTDWHRVAKDLVGELHRDGRAFSLQLEPLATERARLWRRPKEDVLQAGKLTIRGQLSGGGNVAVARLVLGLDDLADPEPVVELAKAIVRRVALSAGDSNPVELEVVTDDDHQIQRVASYRLHTMMMPKSPLWKDVLPPQLSLRDLDCLPRSCAHLSDRRTGQMKAIHRRFDILLAAARESHRLHGNRLITAGNDAFAPYAVVAQEVHRWIDEPWFVTLPESLGEYDPDLLCESTDTTR
jgi:hypothetical protein